MKTVGEIEAAICLGLNRFEQEYLGRGPANIHAYLRDDLLIVRANGVLTTAEQKLALATPIENGRELLKGVRTRLVATAQPQLVALVEDIARVNVVCVHHDISTVTGEEFVVFVLGQKPSVRAPNRQ